MEQAQIAQSGFSNSRFTGRNFNGRRGGRGGCFGCGGASHHLTHDASNLITANDYTGPDQLFIANGSAHYTCLVGAMARAGHLEQAERVALTMPYKPDAAVWRALLSACAFHGEADKAWSMARRVLELEPLDDSAYVIVANVLSAAGRWDDVAELRKMLRDRRVKKQGGRSWIEVQGKVHVFAAGDWKHERSAEIYRKLEEIMGEIEKLGYVPIWDELLHNVEEEKRKEALWHHSEKLAVAFGMLCGSAPPGKPLRIVKNLRICKDCHEAKYMTRILEREIIVRDVNRYHRFVDGNCTCRDIW
ncbi:pentatricopeptide repeat-containing protein At2g41080-like isoform X5 [Arachis stenosperma]|uniref:pentatricopeptide repeat-containing protein At2g41080-like isoform X5 n=1 Tax=Arachis stenosperma TaxID=217475 RepID=UPI0025AB68F8|nr:pentatricopeptide repeat-containing protein At2g41080-like isoform X5 [Arachis stenosperma]